LKIKVEKLLQKNEITELANKLALSKSDTTEDLLMKLSVFSRAGHRRRVHKALKEISRIYPNATNKEQILATVKKHFEVAPIKRTVC